MHKVPHLQATGFTNTNFKQIWHIQSSVLKRCPFECKLLKVKTSAFDTFLKREQSLLKKENRTEN